MGQIAILRALRVARLAPVAALMMLGACTTLEAHRPVAPSYALAPPPSQFLAFCDRYPGECATLSKAPAVARAIPAPAASGRAPAPAPRAARYDWSYAFAVPSERRRSQVSVMPSGVSYSQELGRLVAVNREVNRTIRFRSDKALFGVDDYWSLPVSGRDGLRYGDCEDYALEKRSQLLGQGVDANNLALAVVRTSKGEIHAVLLVATDAGEMMLDSLSSTVIPWKQSTYTLIARQAAGDVSTWVQPG